MKEREREGGKKTVKEGEGREVGVHTRTSLNQMAASEISRSKICSLHTHTSKHARTDAQLGTGTMAETD